MPTRTYTTLCLPLSSNHCPGRSARAKTARTKRTELLPRQQTTTLCRAEPPQPPALHTGALGTRRRQAQRGTATVTQLLAGGAQQTRPAWLGPPLPPQEACSVDPEVPRGPRKTAPGSAPALPGCPLAYRNQPLPCRARKCTNGSQRFFSYCYIR